MRKAAKAVIGTTLSIALAGGGIWGAYAHSGRTRKPVMVASAAACRYEFWEDAWGDSEYGEAVEKDAQYIFRDPEKKPAKICVREGDTVSIGDELMAYDTELLELKKEMQELDTRKLEIELSLAEKELSKLGFDPAMVSHAALDLPPIGKETEMLYEALLETEYLERTASADVQPEIEIAADEGTILIGACEEEPAGDMAILSDAENSDNYSDAEDAENYPDAGEAALFSDVMDESANDASDLCFAGNEDLQNAELTDEVLFPDLAEAGDENGILLMDDGSDSLAVEDGIDTVEAADGDELLLAGDTSETLLADDGSETLLAGDENEDLSAAAGSRSVDEIAAEDFFAAAEEVESVYGRAASPDDERIDEAYFRTAGAWAQLAVPTDEGTGTDPFGEVRPLESWMICPDGSETELTVRAKKEWYTVTRAYAATLVARASSAWGEGREDADSLAGAAADAVWIYMEAAYCAADAAGGDYAEAVMMTLTEETGPDGALTAPLEHIFAGVENGELIIDPEDPGTEDLTQIIDPEDPGAEDPMQIIDPEDPGTEDPTQIIDPEDPGAEDQMQIIDPEVEDMDQIIDVDDDNIDDPADMPDDPGFEFWEDVNPEDAETETELVEVRETEDDEDEPEEETEEPIEELTEEPSEHMTEQETESVTEDETESMTEEATEDLTEEPVILSEEETEEEIETETEEIEEEETEEDDEEEDDEDGDDEEEEGTEMTQEERLEAIDEMIDEVREIRLKIDESKMETKDLEQQISACIVKASVNGTITQLDESAGEDEEFIVVTGGKGLYVSGTVTESQLENVTVGTKVTGQSYETGNSFTATIAEISPYPASEDSFYGYGAGGDSNETRYPFLAYIDSQEDAEQGEVEYSVQADNDVSTGFYLESFYIRTDANGARYVMVSEDGKLARRRVKTGKTVDGMAEEILGGLRPSDLIAFPYGDGDKVGAKTQETERLSLY